MAKRFKALRFHITVKSKSFRSVMATRPNLRESCMTIRAKKLKTFFILLIFF
jgi:hypothetical protein